MNSAIFSSLVHLNRGRFVGLALICSIFFQLVPNEAVVNSIDRFYANNVWTYSLPFLMMRYSLFQGWVVQFTLNLARPVCRPSRHAYNLSLTTLGALTAATLLLLVGRVLLEIYLFLRGSTATPRLVVTPTEESTSGFDRHQTQRGYVVEYITSSWPTMDRQMQYWLCVKLAHVIRDRVLNAAIPLLLGSVVDDPSFSKVWFLVGLGLLSDFDVLEGFSMTRITNSVQDKLADRGQSCVLNQTPEQCFASDPDDLADAIEQGSDPSFIVDEVMLEGVFMILDVIIGVFILGKTASTWIAAVIICLGMMSVLITVAGTRWLNESCREEVNMQSTARQVLHKSIRYWQTVFVYQLHNQERARYNKARAKMFTARRHYHQRFYLLHGFYSLANSSGLLVALLLTMKGVRNGTMSGGTLALVYAYWRSITKPLSRFAGLWPRLSGKVASARKLLDMIAAQSSPNSDEGRQFPIIRGQITFDNVSFQILKDICFTAAPGSCIAITGKSGSGKSTLIRLILRLHDTKKGAVKIDGVDLGRYTRESLLQQVAVVTQSTEIFPRSIMENVMLARRGASVEEVHDACQKAGLHEQILRWEDGYDTVVGDGGFQLSGGEAQRVAIARAFLRDPKIMVLDEATSAVDSITEAHILRTVKQLSSNRTTFIVAHRLSTIQHADLILVLSEGQIIERGKHDELLANNGTYAELWALQNTS